MCVPLHWHCTNDITEDTMDIERSSHCDARSMWKYLSVDIRPDIELGR